MHPVCHLSETSASSTLNIYNVKERLSNEPRATFTNELAWGLVQAFTFNILSQIVVEVKAEKRERGKLSRSTDIYRRFLDAVEKNYTRERDIKFYADKLCLTPKYLSQVVF